MEITTIGLDLAKHVFQVHGIAADGSAVLKKRLRRGQVHAFFAGLKPCLVAWRSARPRTSGRASSEPLVMTYG